MPLSTKTSRLGTVGKFASFFFFFFFFFFFEPPTFSIMNQITIIMIIIINVINLFTHKIPSFVYAQNI